MQRKFRNCLALAFIALSSLGCKHPETSDSAEKIYSSEGTHVEISFTNVLFFAVPEKHQKSLNTILQSDFREVIDKRLAYQLDFLTGTLLSYKQFADYPGVVGGRPKIELLGVDPVPGQPSLGKLRYRYKDRGMFNKALVNASPVTVTLILPAIVDDFYERAKSKDGKTVCVAGGNTEEEKFWYYWKVDAPGCNLKSPDILTFQARVTPLPETRNTRPWYSEMFAAKDKGSKNLLKATLLFGESSLDRDEAATLEALVKEGFKDVSQAKDRSRLLLERNHVDLELTIFKLNGGTSAFKSTAAKALTQSDIFIYIGHSSYGAYLDPEVLGLKRDSFNQTKAQTFYFAGCRSFRYYNAKYFDLKPRKLNIVTTSVPSYGLTFPFVVPEFLLSFTDESRYTWSKIIDRMQAAENKGLTEQKAAGYSEPYILWPKFKAIISVNGDENNPTN